MAKKKWYVVTVGKDIGVFETWLEAGPLVKGIPDALHQSFPTEEQARRIFAQEVSRGNTRIVGDEKVSSPRRPVVRSSTFSNDGNAPPGMSSKSIILNNHHLPQQHGNFDMLSHSGRFSHHSSSPTASTTTNSRNTISRTSSEPSSRFRRHQIIDALFKEDHDSVEVEARALANHAQVSSSTMNLTGFSSPRMETQPDTYCGVIVKTPTWLTSYPQRKAHQSESQPLSPLNSADMPLNSFIPDRLSGKSSAVDHTSRITADLSTPNETRSTNKESAGESSIYLSPSPRQTAKIMYTHDADPRSPIMNKTQVPELAYPSSLYFSRPSPMAKTERLPVHHEPKHPLQTSLLFESSHVGSSVNDHIVHSP